MLVDGGDEFLLGGGDEVPHDVARGGRAYIVVVAPGEIDRTGNTTGEVDQSKA